MEEHLEHFGVPGMKWGVRKDKRGGKLHVTKKSLLGRARSFTKSVRKLGYDTFVNQNPPKKVKVAAGIVGGVAGASLGVFLAGTKGLG